jgi:hypothetical protein
LYAVSKVSADEKATFVQAWQKSRLKKTKYQYQTNRASDLLNLDNSLQNSFAFNPICLKHNDLMLKARSTSANMHLSHTLLFVLGLFAPTTLASHACLKVGVDIDTRQSRTLPVGLL